MQLLHDDDDPANLALPNISYGTPKQNAEDERRNGRTAGRAPVGKEKS